MTRTRSFKSSCNGSIVQEVWFIVYFGHCQVVPKRTQVYFLFYGSLENTGFWKISCIRLYEKYSFTSKYPLSHSTCETSTCCVFINRTSLIYLFRNSKYILLAHKFNSTTMNGIRLILQIIAHLCILLSFCMIISAITIPKWWRLNVKMANKDHINADVGLWEFCSRFPGKLNEVRKLHLYFTCQYSISAQEFSKIS